MTVTGSRRAGVALALALAGGVLLVAAAAPPRPAAAAQAPQEFLDGLVGEWRGSGFIVRRTGGAQETALCRLTTRRAASGIRNEGRCAASSAGGDVEGSLHYDAGRSVFVGSFLDPEARSMKPAVGTLEGGVLTLGRTELRGGDEVRIVATVRIEDPDRYRVNVIETAAGEERTVLRLTFTRR